MLHQRIEEDPDVRVAIKDFRPTVVDIRHLSAQLITLRAGGPEHQAASAAVQDLVSGMELRAERLGLTLDDLFRYVNDDLAASPPPAGALKPQGQLLRDLLDENTAAYAEEHRLYRERTALDVRIAAATDRRIAADRACGGFVAGWAVRGGQPA